MHKRLVPYFNQLDQWYNLLLMVNVLLMYSTDWIRTINIGHRLLLNQCQWFISKTTHAAHTHNTWPAIGHHKAQSHWYIKPTTTEHNNFFTVYPLGESYTKSYIFLTFLVYCDISIYQPHWRLKMKVNV